MVRNGNSDNVFNNFTDLSAIPNQIVKALIQDDSEEAEMFWKLLVYSQPDALEKPNLTEDEKIDCIYKGETLENNYHIFYKPLIGAALDTAEAQTQMRIYRPTTNPKNRLEAIIDFSIVLITNEKESIIRHNGIIKERTDLMEELLLNLLNGRDLGVGIGTLNYDDNLSRGCGSTLGINNAKTFYGRTITLALRFMGVESDDRYCG